MDQLGQVIANFQAQLTTKINIGDTTATIDKNTDADGEEIPNGKYFLTVDVDSSRKEHYACTLTRTADGSTLTNLKTLNRTTGAETSGSLRLHRIGAKVVITDFATILKVALKLSGQEGINPSSPMYYTSEPSLSSGLQLATVQYVLDVATGGSLSFDTQIISAQTAGEDGILVNDVVYFKESDAKWYKVEATDTTTFQGVRIGFSQTIADENDPMQVAISGPINAFTGLTPGAKYYASDTAGLVTATPGTNPVFIGWALNSTNILISIKDKNIPSDNEKDAMAGGGDFGTPSSTNKFTTEQRMAKAVIYCGDGSDGNVTISSPTTLTKDMHYDNLIVNSTLDTAGYIIYVKNELSGTGTIKYNGNAGGNGADGSTFGVAVNGAGGAVTATGLLKNTAGSTSVSGTSYQLTSRQSGGNAYKGNGAGTGKYGGGSGGGGASGGIIIIYALKISGTLTISATGGNGGNGGVGVGGSFFDETYNGGFTGTGFDKKYSAKIDLYENIFSLNVTTAALELIKIPSAASGAVCTVTGNNAGGGGGGGGGNGGIILIFTYDYSGGVPTLVVTGGTKGTGGSGGGTIPGDDGYNGENGKALILTV